MGDGIVPPDSADDDETRAIINDIISCVGSETDRSGALGVSQAKVDQFFADLQAYSDWWKQAEDSAPTTLPFGNATPSAAETLNAVQAKVDDYFTRCRLAEFDARAAAVLNRSQEDLAALASKDLSAFGAEVAPFPLARIDAGKPLPLRDGVNPAWAEALGKLEAEVITPLLGAERTSLTVGEWAALCAKFGSYREWLAKKAGASVEIHKQMTLYGSTHRIFNFTLTLVRPGIHIKPHLHSHRTNRNKNHDLPNHKNLRI